MSPFPDILVLRDSSQTDQPQGAPKSSSRSKSFGGAYMSILALIAVLLCFVSIRRARREAKVRRQRELGLSEGPESVPMKDDEDDEEIKPQIMYEVYLKDERVQEGIPSDLSRKGWANVMPVSSSLVPLPDTVTSVRWHSDIGQDAEANASLEIAPLSSDPWSIVTSMLITMPTPQAPEPDNEKISCSTSDGTISPTDQRLGDMFFGVHEVLGVQQPTRTP